MKNRTKIKVSSKKVVELIEKTRQIVKELSPHSQAYFSDLESYMLLSSLFHDERDVREQVYTMALDLKEAEHDGLTAEEFFGNKPQEMVKEILANTAFEQGRNLLKLLFCIVGVLFFIRFQSDFMNKGLVTISPLPYLIDSLLGIIGVLTIFWTVQQSIYHTNRKGEKARWPLAICFGILFVLMTYRLLEDQLLKTTALLTFSPLWSVITTSLLLALAVYICWQLSATFRPFIIYFLAFYLSGLLRLAENQGLLKEEWLTRGLPTGLLTLATILFFTLSVKLISQKSEKN